MLNENTFEKNDNAAPQRYMEVGATSDWQRPFGHSFDLRLLSTLDITNAPEAGSVVF